MRVHKLSAGGGPMSVGGNATRGLRTRSFRLIRRSRNSTSPFSPEGHTRIGCQGRVASPCVLASSVQSPFLTKRLLPLVRWSDELCFRLSRSRSNHYCHAQKGEEVLFSEETSAAGYQNTVTTKPAVWNPSFKKRLNKLGVGGDVLFHDTGLSALQGSICGLCDSDDTSVSRRAFLKSLINGRMKDIGYNGGFPGDGNSGNGGNGKGYGGSGGDSGFGSSGPWGWGGFFFSGVRGWVFIAAAITLVTSVLGQIFRSAGNPTSRTTGGSTDVSTSKSRSEYGGSESDGVKLHLHKGGSLSHASSHRRFRGNRTSSPKKEPSPLSFFSLSEQSGLWSRDEESNELEYTGFFHSLLYPPSQTRARAFYRCAVRLVGPKPGDWVEVVDQEQEGHQQSLNATTLPTSELQGPINAEAESSQITEQANYKEDIVNLRSELKQVQQLLSSTEAKHQGALLKLKENSNDFEVRELALRSTIKNHEDVNQKIRSRLHEIDSERRKLARSLEEAKSSLLCLNPAVEHMDGHINELSTEVQSYKTNLRLMENQLVLTSRERDAVVQRMDVLYQDVNEMESVLEVIQKSQELIIGSENEAFGEKIQKVESCVQALQSFDLKPTGGRHLSPIREVNQRVVLVFKKLLSEMRRSFVQCSKCVSRIEAIQSEFSDTTRTEKDLREQLAILKEQQQRIQEEKETSELMMESLQNDLSVVHEQLDGTTIQEEKLRQSIEKLTSDKDELSAMARKFQREIDDIENLLSTMDNTRNLILQSIPSEMGVEHITMLENCLAGLQQQQMTLADSSSPVTENLTNRLMNTFEGLLVQTKQCLLRAEEAKRSLNQVEEDLAGALAEEDSLNKTVASFREQLSDMASTKCNLSNDVGLLKSELEEKLRNLDQLKMELSELDRAREEQAKEIESLREDLDKKKSMIHNSKEAEVELKTAIHDITEEKDDLIRQLQSNEDNLMGSRQKLEELLEEKAEIQGERDALAAEKTKLETQLSGLQHRINELMSENERLNAVAATIKSNLDDARRATEQLDQENAEIMDQQADLHEKFTAQVEGLRERLENAQSDCVKLKETCETLEEAKVRLEQELEEEHAKYDEQLAKLKNQYQQPGAGASSPPIKVVSEDIPQSPFLSESLKIEESPSVLQAPASESCIPNEGAIGVSIEPSSRHGADFDVGEEEEGEEDAPLQNSPPGDSKVLTWLDDAQRAPPPWAGSSVPSERNVETAPMQQNTEEIIESLIPAAGGMNEQRIFRRSSWPQDMTNALSDNLFGAAQELVDMTTATLALAAEKNGLETDLNEVQQAITETKGMLEEREAEVSELTEHFLQVYQIASDLATDNEAQSNELRDLRLMYERQKQDIEIRDERLTYLELAFASINEAPPRHPIPSSHYSESMSNFRTPIAAQKAPRDFSAEIDSRMNAFTNSGYDSSDVIGRSPRLDAPGTPSMISMAQEPVAPRAISSTTYDSLHSRQEADDFMPSANYTSVDDMSSLSGASDEVGSNAEYPETEVIPIGVDIMS